MYKNIGIIEINYITNGDWQDLANVLLNNGYTLEIELIEPLPFNDESGKLRIAIKEKIESEV